MKTYCSDPTRQRDRAAREKAEQAASQPINARRIVVLKRDQRPAATVEPLSTNVAPASKACHAQPDLFTSTKAAFAATLEEIKQRKAEERQRIIGR